MIPGTDDGLPSFPERSTPPRRSGPRPRNAATRRTIKQFNLNQARAPAPAPKATAGRARLPAIQPHEYAQTYHDQYREAAISKVRVDEDIRPLSELRAAVASFVKQIQETQRPMVLTHRGRGVAVLIDVRELERMQERLETLEDLCRADAQLAAGEGVPQDEARARVLRAVD